FLPGNHDWGGLGGVDAVLRPAPGDPGPAVVDLGRGLRLLMIDSQWWLEPQSRTRREAAAEALRRALAGADDRALAVLAHHPTASAGEHARAPWSAALGFRRLLQNAGVLAQDLTSERYRDYVTTLRNNAIATRRPLLMAGGHDHTLQLLVGREPGAAPWIVVSGAGSKSSVVRAHPDLRFHHAAPGYARLLVGRDGRVTLTFVAGPPDVLTCPVGPSQADCIAAGAERVQAVRTLRLRGTP
ncbi:MAG: hypothetical protein D6701_13380, partial [Gemmatimonadetes bacterium]